MDLLKILQALVDNGATALITAIFLFIYLKNERQRSKRMNESEKRRIEKEDIREKFINEILFQQLARTDQVLVNTKKTHTAKEDAFLEEINRCINKILIKLRESTASNRAMFVKYHNNEYDLNGISTIKMSATNESVSSNTPPIMHSFKNQHRSFFSWWCSEIRKKGECFVEDIESIKEHDPGYYGFLNNRAVKAIYGKAIENGKNEIVGFIIIEYLDKPAVTEEKIRDCLNDKSKKISNLLTLTKNQMLQQ